MVAGTGLGQGSSKRDHADRPELRLAGSSVDSSFAGRHSLSSSPCRHVDQTSPDHAPRSARRDSGLRALPSPPNWLGILFKVRDNRWLRHIFLAKYDCTASTHASRILLTVNARLPPSSVIVQYGNELDFLPILEQSRAKDHSYLRHFDFGQPFRLA